MGGPHRLSRVRYFVSGVRGWGVGGIEGGGWGMQRLLQRRFCVYNLLFG